MAPHAHSRDLDCVACSPHVAPQGVQSHHPAHWHASVARTERRPKDPSSETGVRVKVQAAFTNVKLKDVLYIRAPSRFIYLTKKRTKRLIH